MNWHFDPPALCLGLNTSEKVPHCETHISSALLHGQVSLPRRGLDHKSAFLITTPKTTLQISNHLGLSQQLLKTPLVLDKLSCTHRLNNLSIGQHSALLSRTCGRSTSHTYCTISSSSHCSSFPLKPFLNLPPASACV